MKTRTVDFLFIENGAVKFNSQSSTLNVERLKFLFEESSNSAPNVRGKFREQGFTKSMVFGLSDVYAAARRTAWLHSSEFGIYESRG